MCCARVHACTCDLALVVGRLARVLDERVVVGGKPAPISVRVHSLVVTRAHSLVAPRGHSENVNHSRERGAPSSASMVLPGTSQPRRAESVNLSCRVSLLEPQHRSRASRGLLQAQDPAAPTAQLRRREAAVCITRPTASPGPSCGLVKQQRASRGLQLAHGPAAA